MPKLIGNGDYIKCNNARTYRVLDNWDNKKYNYKLMEHEEVINEVSGWYINDCFKFGESICVGKLSGNPIYAKILEVFDSIGRLKHTYESGK